MSDNARDQAKAQLSSVRAMVAALNCDYDRLEELREELSEVLELRQESLKLRQAQCAPGASRSVTDALVIFQVEHGDRLRELEDQIEDEFLELTELEEAAGDCESEDDARQRIEEDALSVEVRSGWESMGSELSPAEFRIVLCTGGPHVEIQGELNDYNEPESVRLLFQDWFEGKQEYICDSDETADLIAYARVFYFGE